MDAEKRSRCVDCGEMKLDPAEFYDGLRCIECCEAAERREPLKGADGRITFGSIKAFMDKHVRRSR